MRLIGLAFCVALAAIGLATGCGGDDEPSDLSVSGTLSVPALTTNPNGETCYGTAGYDDIKLGSQVTITRSSGEIAGLGTLDDVELLGGKCVFEFVVDGVPGDDDFYGVEVGSRGAVNYTRDDLEEPVELRLGS